MNITSFDQIELKSAYGILCHSLPNLGPSDALKPTFCLIKPGEQSIPHSHFEPEIFFIICGQGKMKIGENSQLIKAGDLIRIPSFSLHQITNTQETDLQFLSIYTEDLDLSPLPENVLITAAPPTPNGPLHLGHISGPYLAADIMARYLKSKNVNVITRSGTDDHQNYVSEKARSLKISTEDFRQNRRARIQRGLMNMDIPFDQFIEPGKDSFYQDKIKDFFHRAIISKVIVKESILMPHCEECDLTLVDVHADGTCPSCHSPSRGGCESCGIVVAPNELLNVHCGRCGRPAIPKLTDVYTFNLSQHLPGILSEIQSLSLSPRLQQLVRNVSQQKNLKVLVAYPTSESNGIKVAEQNLHVWFEMAADYESLATQSSYWIHSFGFDNSFYYLLYIPALLRAMKPDTRLPDAVITNEFLLLEGAKFSTSRGHAIWADEFDGDTEHLRLYLAYIRPSEQTTDFSMTEFNTFSTDLKMKLEILFERLNDSQPLNDLNELSQSKPSQRTLAHIQRFTRSLDLALTPPATISSPSEVSLASNNETTADGPTINIREAAHLILTFLDSTTHSLSDVANFLAQAKALAQALLPLMPETSAKILKAVQIRQIDGRPETASRTPLKDIFSQHHTPVDAIATTNQQGSL